MSRYRVEYLPEATAAIRANYRYITREDGPGNAARWLKRFKEETDKLKTDATIYPVVVIRNKDEIRSKLILSHRLYYKIADATKTVFVLDVVHTARQSRLDEYETED